MNQTIYDAAGGRQAFVDLAHAWHVRCLADPVVSHAFSHGFHPQHTERLAAYWAEALGGPEDFSRAIGDESAVVRMHSGNGEHREMDERAIDCFDAALDDAGSCLMAKLAYDPMTRGSKPAASAILLPLKLRPPKRSTSTPPPDP